MANEITEIWKAIAGYEGRYEVSNMGRVRSLDQMVKHPTGSLKRWRGRVLKATVYSTGYPMVNLGSNKIARSVHRLVAKAFIPNPENKPHVNHLNGIKLDARSTNLEWCTPSENEKHSYASLGKRPNLSGLGRRGALHAQSKPVYQYTVVGRFVREHEGASEASRWLVANGLPKATQGRISVCARGESAWAYGYIWLYDKSGLPESLKRVINQDPRIRKRDAARFSF